MVPESPLQSVLGTWKLISYVREVLDSDECFNQFGENPAGYLGYSADGRMYAIFVRQDRITPGDVVPTEEEGVKLLGTMVAYAGKFTLDAEKVVHHIDVSWNQAWTGTDQVRYYHLNDDVLTITTAPYRSYHDGRRGRSVLVWKKVKANAA
jgi:Lipocalin-like domain